ncbi:hypothetical protein JNJ66_06950 [Candidatus Saccharibacteria bacterium]|nr:hypothetical protein [Candidatus Saccharibacteria bacterium]
MNPQAPTPLPPQPDQPAPAPAGPQALPSVQQVPQPAAAPQPQQTDALQPVPEPEEPQVITGQAGGTIAEDGAFVWDAEEYAYHSKGPAWFMVLGAVTLVLTIGAVVLQQYLFAVLLVIMGVTLGFFAAHPPRRISYRLTPTTVQVGDKLFDLHRYRSFGILPDEDMYLAIFRPVKKVAPGISIRFSDAEGEQIVDILGSVLPMEEFHEDLIDRIMRRLRF